MKGLGVVGRLLNMRNDHGHKLVLWYVGFEGLSTIFYLGHNKGWGGIMFMFPSLFIKVRF
jgi:hypothetical protein